MENFGKLIDDIRKNIKLINIQFEEVPLGDSMVITIPPSKRKIIIDTTKTGALEYNTPMYEELLNMTIEELKTFI